MPLKAPNALLVNCGSRAKPQLIPSELCYVVGGQPARRTLSPLETAGMIKFAARFPNLNAASIEGPGLQAMAVTQTQGASYIVSSNFSTLFALLTGFIGKIRAVNGNRDAHCTSSNSQGANNYV